MQELTGFFHLVILIMSIVIHEVSHGYVAYAMGDDTAWRQGRLTMNPLRHLDLFGSIIIPVIFMLSGTGLMFGWAKPVPFNPNNLRDRRRGTILVASAGILANLFIALLFGIGIRLAFHFGFASESIISLALTIVIINSALFTFNLVPVPPLDGSRILFEILPPRLRHIGYALERYAIFILLAFVFFGWQYIVPIIGMLVSLFTGLPNGVY